MSGGYSVRLLTEETWPAFAELVEANNGVWGGCWCMGFHVKLGEAEQNRAGKEQLVRERRTHNALVFDGDRCLGWCQFGSPEELPLIKSRRLYDKGLVALPDWRITCFFTGKGLRGRGVAQAALGGALEE
ncbi:MAG TPA: GNAT family N-acetyltransferase, partial [Kribbella sp.]